MRKVLIEGFKAPNFLPVVVACRPRQWPKNLLVFAAPLFSFRFDADVWFYAVGALFSFCLISSTIYYINDLIDIVDDRDHPLKKNRPIASGLIRTKFAFIIVFILLSLSFLIALCISREMASLILLYFLIQIAYCFKLKKEPLLDVFCIAAGFLLRAIAGGVAGGLQISPWFLLTIGLLALFLALEKRKAELRSSLQSGIVTREVLQRYSLPLLLRLESLVATSSFIAYSLWAAGPSLGGAETSWMLLTVPFVLAGIFRYQFLSDPDESDRRKVFKPLRTSENPEEILLGDRGIRLTVGAWLLTTILIGLITRLVS
tara:strand:- start:9315 stop:10262 length:948 start_codon:yes stop_codon:yes gene_type:complete